MYWQQMSSGSTCESASRNATFWIGRAWAETHDSLSDHWRFSRIFAERHLCDRSFVSAISTNNSVDPAHSLHKAQLFSLLINMVRKNTYSRRSTSLAQGMLLRKSFCTLANRFVGEQPKGIRKELRPLRRSARLQQGRTHRSIQTFLPEPKNSGPSNPVSLPSLSVWHAELMGL